MKPIVVNPARRHAARGCLWRRCRSCHDLVQLPDRMHVCGPCATSTQHWRSGHD